MDIRPQKKAVDKAIRVETVTFGTCVEYEGVLYIVSSECPSANCTIISLQHGTRLVVPYGTLVRVVKAHIQVEE